MPKEQYRESDVAKKISHITFSVESAENIEQLSHVQVVSPFLYNQDNNRTPIKHGLLDPRMGISGKDRDCETCAKKLNDCVGHFGYFDLSVPLYHPGFFRSIITILQSICKKCGHILLPQSDKDKFIRSLTNPYLSYYQRKSVRQIIIKKCKKNRKCSNSQCNYTNGMVKKFVSKGGNFNNMFGIVHEKSVRDRDLRDKLEEHHEVIKMNPDMESEIMNSLSSEVLTPIDVLTLFRSIPENDMVFLCMNPLRSRPVDLIMTKMLVPPVCIRPSIVSDIRNGTNEDDLTMLQSKILFTDHEFANSRCSKITPTLYREKYNSLQLYTALYFNSDLSGIPPNMKEKRTRGVAQRLAGKQGRFRGNLSGKRVDFSARTVISPDPNLEIDQVGVPVHIAKILTFTEPVIKANILKMKQLVLNGPDKWPGANYVIQKRSGKKFLKYLDRKRLSQELKEGDKVERHLADNDMVLFNRQPSLHRLSIMAHRAKVHNHRTFRFNECVCNPYNADFDGDEMNLHLPQTLEAKAEAYEILNVKNNLVTPKNGEILIAATQDFLSGAFIMTRKDKFYTFRQVAQLLNTMLAGSDINMDVDLPVPAILKPRRLWTGKQIFGLILRPNKASPVKVNLEAKGKSYSGNRELCVQDSYVIIRNSELLAGSLDKTHLGSGGRCENIFYVLLKDFKSDCSIKCMWRLAKLASYFLMHTGFSIGISDVMPNEALIEKRNLLLEKGYDDCHNLIEDKSRGRLQCQPGCSLEESLEIKLLRTLSDIRDNAGKVCLSELHPTNSPLIMTLCGSKGSNINISQMVACVGQQALSGKRVPNCFDRRGLPHFFYNSIIPAAKGFVKNSFFSGLVPTEFFFHTMGGREGLVDTAVKTAETGYMQRRLVKSLEDLVVCHDKTVRNADNQVVQLLYGNDGLDPAEMESSEGPVDFDRVLHVVRALYPFRNEVPLIENQIRCGTETYLSQNLHECDEDFRKQLSNFMDSIADKLKVVTKQHGTSQVVKEIERLTCSQLVSFFETCRIKYRNSIIQAGTAVGAVAAQSIGEPGTQMTLKTFHFAGVASMNITQGVPRIKEIINATKCISTPIIKAQVLQPDNELYAGKVKARLEKTTLREISHLKVVIDDDSSYIIIKLNVNVIKCLTLEVNAETIRYSLCKSKLKLQPQDVLVDSPLKLIVHPNSKHLENCGNALNELKEKLPNVIIKGLPTVNRAVIARETRDDKPHHYLCVEGSNLREVMATYGVNGCKTTSNNVIEVYETLGIEAARTTIMCEIGDVLKNHGMSVDIRHIMLLATQMTHSGKVLGITRDGLDKMNQSVLTLASFEKTADHLYDAAYYGRTDKSTGVSENIIMGMPAPIGTSVLKLLHTPVQKDEDLKTLPLLFEEL